MNPGRRSPSVRFAQSFRCAPRPTSRLSSRGFTLVELLIAMAVMMTIAAIAVPSMMGAMYQAKIAKAVGDIHAIEDDVTIYEVMNDHLPSTLADIGRDTLHDPWGHPYQYLDHTNVKGKGGFRKDRFLVPLNSDYDLYSMGQDGDSVAPLTAKKSQDDIVRASNGSYVGLASNF